MMMKMILVKFNTMQLMKKIISIMMLFAAAAMAFNSCQKQEVVAPEKANEVTLTFSSEKPSFVDESKTEWNGSSIIWSAGDKISVAYTVAGKWQNASGDASGDAKLYKSDGLKAASETAQFNVNTNFKGESTGKHVFYGVYPALESTSFANAPTASVIIPSSQTPGAVSFDPNGDLMVGVSVEYDSRPSEEETIALKWHRLVAHAVITLKTLNGFTSGEILTGIKLTAQSDANLVGKQDVNLLTREVAKNNDAANVLNLTCGNLSLSNDGTVSFWACILPETLTSLIVEVETDKATYTREITGINKTFKQNARNTLAVNMSTATRVAKETESWQLVTPADGLTAGTYVLVAKTATNTGALVSTNGTGSAPTFDTTISLEDNTLKGVTENIQFDLTGTTDNYVLSVAGDATKWLYCTNSNNGVRVGDNTNKTWTITAHSSNANAFVFKHKGTSRYLGVYNNQDWRCYDELTKFDDVNGNTGTIYLYKKESGSVAPDTTPELSLELAELQLTSEENEGNFTVTSKNLPADIQVRALTAKDAQDEVDWLIVEYANGVILYTAKANESEDARTAYIEAYVSDDLKDGVIVTQAGKPAEGAQTEVTDVLTRETTGVTKNNTSYSSWSGKSVSSSAVYAGNSAGGNDAIQLRSNNNNSGVVTTTSGGYAKKIVVKWQSATQSGRTLDVYGKNTAYIAATDLYNSTNQGTKLGSIKSGTSTELVITGEYQYIGLRSADGAMYLSEIAITWSSEAGSGSGETPEPEQPTLTPRNLAFSAATATATVGQAFTAPTLSGVTTGVTYSSSNTAVATVNNSGVVTIVGAGTTTIKASALATDQYEAGEASYTLTVSAAPSSGTKKTFTIKSDDIVSNSGYQAYTTTVDGRSWVITCGGNNKSVGVNSSNRSKCNLVNTNYKKYAVSPITTSSTASAFASTTQLRNVSKISYAKLSGGSNHASTKIYILYSPDGTTFSQISLTSGTQGATINTSSGGTFEFAECSGYFAVVFAATNTSGNWRLDDVNLTFTYTE